LTVFVTNLSLQGFSEELKSVLKISTIEFWTYAFSCHCLKNETITKVLVSILDNGQFFHTFLLSSKACYVSFYQPWLYSP